jgi:hypothetical protein
LLRGFFVSACLIVLSNRVRAVCFDRADTVESGEQKQPRAVSYLDIAPGASNLPATEFFRGWLFLLW